MLPFTSNALLMLMQDYSRKDFRNELWQSILKAAVINNAFPEGLKVTPVRSNKNDPERIYTVTNLHLDIDGNPNKPKTYDLVFNGIGLEHGCVNLYPYCPERIHTFIVRGEVEHRAAEFKFTPPYEQKLKALMYELEDEYNHCLWTLSYGPRCKEVSKRDVNSIKKGTLFYMRGGERSVLNSVKGPFVIFETAIAPTLDKNNTLVNCIILTDSGCIPIHSDCLMSDIEVEEYCSQGDVDRWDGSSAPPMDEASDKFFTEVGELLTVAIENARKAYEEKNK
jgi:hypothetical protein